VPFYALNEWIVLKGGLGLVTKFVDTGGSIVIHAFGAIFGLCVALSMTTQKEYETPIESDDTSDRYSFLAEEQQHIVMMRSSKLKRNHS
jgi:ammonium transporter Rh